MDYNNREKKSISSPALKRNVEICYIKISIVFKTALCLCGKSCSLRATPAPPDAESIGHFLPPRQKAGRGEIGVGKMGMGRFVEIKDKSSHIKGTVSTIIKETFSH